MAKQTSPSGRKYRLVIIGILALLGGFGLTALNPVLSSNFSTFVGGLTILLGVYKASNVAQKALVKNPLLEQPEETSNGRRNGE